MDPLAPLVELADKAARQTDYQRHHNRGETWTVPPAQLREMYGQKARRQSPAENRLRYLRWKAAGHRAITDAEAQELVVLELARQAAKYDRRRELGRDAVTRFRAAYPERKRANDAAYRAAHRALLAAKERERYRRRQAAA